jgi:hypothetical protein
LCSQISHHGDPKKCKKYIYKVSFQKKKREKKEKRKKGHKSQYYEEILFFLKSPNLENKFQQIAKNI